MKHTKRTTILAAAIAGLAATSAHAIDVCVVAPLSQAPGAPNTTELGAAMVRGAKIAAAEINIHGGINGEPVRLIIGDDRSDAKSDRAVELAQKAAKRCVATVGIANAGVAVKYNAEAQRLGHPVIISTSAGGRQGSTFADKPVNFVFRAASFDSIQVERLVEYMRYRAIKNPVVLGDSTPYGKAGIEEFQRQWKGTAVNARYETFDISKTEFDDIASKVAKADAYVIWGIGIPAGKLLKAIKEKNPNAIVMSAWAGALDSFVEGAGNTETVTNVVMPLPYVSSENETSTQHKFLKTYRAAFAPTNTSSTTIAGGVLTPAVVSAAAQTHDAMYLLKTGFEAAVKFSGSDRPTGEQIVYGLENMPRALIPGVAASFSAPFTKNNHEAYNKSMLKLGKYSDTGEGKIVETKN